MTVANGQFHGNRRRALIRCWKCCEWTDPAACAPWLQPATQKRDQFTVVMPEDVWCTFCGALVATSSPAALSIPERSLRP